MSRRLVVVTSSMVEVVRCAGGWLFDRGMAGWDVLVLTSDRGDPRPLRILGARAFDLEAALAQPVRAPLPHTLAVGADLYVGDGRVKDGVQRLLDEGRIEVRLWGDSWPEDLDSQVVAPVAHRLSIAARAFKARALGAAASLAGACEDDGLEATEQFRTGTSPGTMRNA